MKISKFLFQKPKGAVIPWYAINFWISLNSCIISFEKNLFFWVWKFFRKKANRLKKIRSIKAETYDYFEFQFYFKKFYFSDQCKEKDVLKFWIKKFRKHKRVEIVRELIKSSKIWRWEVKKVEYEAIEGSGMRMDILKLIAW